MKHRHAFTLVEMLLVVAIIAVLISLLLPALGASRAAARSSVCLSGLSQLHNAHAQYVTNNQMRNFKYLNTGIYMTHLEPYHSFNDEFRFCPEAPYVAGQGGSNHTAWSYSTSNGVKRGSYGLNGFMYHPIGSPTGPGEGGNGYFGSPEYHAPNHPRFWYSTLIQGNPSRAPLYADCMWVDGWPIEKDFVPPDYTGWYGAGIDYRQMARFALDRHRMTINVGLADGSCLNQRLAQLWTLEWHRNWASPSPPVVIP